jgi:hypothetical protein
MHSSAFSRSLYQLRVRSQPQVIVAAERDVFATVHLDMGALRRLEYAAAAAQALGVQRCELRRE